MESRPAGRWGSVPAPDSKGRGPSAAEPLKGGDRQRPAGAGPSPSTRAAGPRPRAWTGPPDTAARLTFPNTATRALSTYCSLSIVLRGRGERVVSAQRGHAPRPCPHSRRAVRPPLEHRDPTHREETPEFSCDRCVRGTPRAKLGVPAVTVYSIRGHRERGHRGQSGRLQARWVPVPAAAHPRMAHGPPATPDSGRKGTGSRAAGLEAGAPGSHSARGVLCPRPPGGVPVLCLVGSRPPPPRLCFLNSSPPQSTQFEYFRFHAFSTLAARSGPPALCPPVARALAHTLFSGRCPETQPGSTLSSPRTHWLGL